MKRKSNFIVTQDKETANKLISEGFRLVTEINDTYTFENRIVNSIVFDSIEKNKLAYTNTLCL